MRKRSGRVAIVRVRETCGEFERETTVKYRFCRGQWVCQGGMRTHIVESGQYRSKVRLDEIEAQVHLDSVVESVRSSALLRSGSDPAELLAGVDCAHPLFLAGVRGA